MEEMLTPGQFPMETSTNMDLGTGVPHYDMVPTTTNFTFPYRAPSSIDEAPASKSGHPATTLAAGDQAPVLTPARRNVNAHRHRKTGSNLPSFTFNATDTSGLDDTQMAHTQTSDEFESSHAPSSSPTRRHARTHTRNNSEFIGGDSRLGQANLIHTAPVATDAAPQDPVMALPAKSSHRRGHSIALSRHDVSQIMSLSAQPRLSTSLPSTPNETLLTFPNLEPSSDPSGPSSSQHPSQNPELEDADRRPVSRREVTFSTRIEYIPRPLSTISSDTESSRSTVRGHSVNNSISSMLSSGIGSPASSRVRSPSLEVTPEHHVRPGPKSSIEVNKRVEKEGEWLKSRVVHDSSGRPLSEPAVASVKSASLPSSEAHVSFRNGHKRTQTAGNDIALDRRRSEPAIGAYMDDALHFSTSSLHDPHVTLRSFPDAKENNRRSSTQKFKDWAMFKFLWKGKDSAQVQAQTRRPLGSPTIKRLPMEDVVDDDIFQIDDVREDRGVQATAESDLDAVFSSDALLVRPAAGPAQLPDPSFRFNPSITRPATCAHAYDPDEHTSMIDLDAALGPFNTPSLGSPKSRRGMHSRRLSRDFASSGAHSTPGPSHRRAESAPVLTRFDHSKSPDLSQIPMADVFEEDEEDEVPSSKSSRQAQSQSFQAADEECGTGVQIVDVDSGSAGSPLGLRGLDGVRASHGFQQGAIAVSAANQRLSTIIPDARASTLLDETIIEEPSPVEAVEIVQAHEEPRAHEGSAKSSDGSDTSTLLAPHHVLYSQRDSQQSLAAPESFCAASFSSPDFSRRQGSFETSRAGTSASSIADNRTMSSYTTGDQTHDPRTSVDDLPSLISSSRSTMMSMNLNASKRDISSIRTPSVNSSTADPVSAAMAAHRRKRRSIQSLSQLVGASFGPKSNLDLSRPQTATERTAGSMPKKEHRLKKLLFWKSKHRQPSDMTSSAMFEP